MFRKSAALWALVGLAVVAPAGCGGEDSPDSRQETAAAAGTAGQEVLPKKHKKPLSQPTGALAKRYPPRVTFAAVCGTTSYLAYKSEGWSNGCTAGSAHLLDARWLVWEHQRAQGVGTAGLRGACHPGCSDKDAYYQAPAKVLLTEPRTCDDNGVKLRYFLRARFTFYARPGNPVREPVGWRHHDFKTQPGACAFAQ